MSIPELHIKIIIPIYYIDYYQYRIDSNIMPDANTEIMLFTLTLITLFEIISINYFNYC